MIHLYLYVACIDIICIVIDSIPFWPEQLEYFVPASKPVPRPERLEYFVPASKPVPPRVNFRPISGGSNHSGQFRPKYKFWLNFFFKNKSYLLLLFGYRPFFFFFFSLVGFQTFLLLFFLLLLVGFGPFFTSSFFLQVGFGPTANLPFLFYLCVVPVMYLTICQPPYTSLNAISFVLKFLFVLFLPAHILFSFVTCVLKFEFFFLCFVFVSPMNVSALTLFHYSTYKY